MNRWKLVVPVVALMAAPFVIGCSAQVQAQPPPPAGPAPEAAPPAEVVVNVAPPAEQVEVVPTAPSVDMVWIKGHWHWNGVGWAWTRGHYEAHRVGWRWVPAHYSQRGGAWAYIPGHWGR